MSGEEVFSEISLIRDDIPIILSSGYSEQDATGRFGDKGLAGFIRKPYRPTVLVDKIRMVLKKQ
jgi:FixJ family two-component response regulator